MMKRMNESGTLPQARATMLEASPPRNAAAGTAGRSRGAAHATRREASICSRSRKRLARTGPVGRTAGKPVPSRNGGCPKKPPCSRGGVVTGTASAAWALSGFRLWRGHRRCRRPRRGFPRRDGSCGWPTSRAGFAWLANGQWSGLLELAVDPAGSVTGSFQSDASGSAYPVTGKVDPQLHQKVQFAIQFPRARQDYQGVLWTEGKEVMAGTLAMLGQDFSFVAVREGSKLELGADMGATALLAIVDSRPVAWLSTPGSVGTVQRTGPFGIIPVTPEQHRNSRSSARDPHLGPDPE